MPSIVLARKGFVITEILIQQEICILERKDLKTTRKLNIPTTTRRLKISGLKVESEAFEAFPVVSTDITNNNITSTSRP